MERGDEGGSRLDRRHLGVAPDELGGQRARSGAHVEDALPRLDAGEVGEERREPRGIAAHELVVGELRDVEHRPQYSRS